VTFCVQSHLHSGRGSVSGPGVRPHLHCLGAWYLVRSEPGYNHPDPRKESEGGAAAYRGMRGQETAICKSFGKRSQQSPHAGVIVTARVSGELSTDKPNTEQSLKVRRPLPCCSKDIQERDRADD
jgi:hypothetical protein